METYWSFRLRLCRTYDSAYDSDFLFSQRQKRSCETSHDSDFVASENQP